MFKHIQLAVSLILEIHLNLGVTIHGSAASIKLSTGSTQLSNVSDEVRSIQLADSWLASNK